MNFILLAGALLLQSVNLAPIPKGIVTGRVLSAEGAPAAGTRVSAMVVPDSTEQTDVTVVLVSVAQTDSQGRYRLENVPPGRYYVVAGQADFPTYYPGTTGLLNARILTVAAGAETDQVNFSMAPAVTVKVTGRVIRESNEARPANEQVLLTNGNLRVIMSTAVAANGTFVFPVVRPGAYQIGPTSRASLPLQDVTVGEKDLDVDVIVPLTVSVSGVSVVDGPGPRPGFTAEFARTGDGAAAYRATVGVLPDGSFSTELPPGEYRLTLSGLPQSFAFDSIRAGSVDLTKETLKVTATDHPSIVARIRVATPSPWMKVSGRVAGPSSTTLSASRLSLRSPGIAESLYAPLNSDGSFEFPMLLPGTYSARILPSTPAPPVSVDIPGGSAIVTGVIVRFPATTEITGRLVMEGGGPIPQVTITFGDSSNQVSVLVTPGSDGRFTMMAPEGERAIVVNPHPGYTLKSATYGAIDLLTSPLHKISETNSMEFQIKLAPIGANAWHKISGKLTAQLPGLAERLTITPLIRTNSGPDPTNGANSSAIGPEGTFEFPTVLNGTYILRTNLPNVPETTVVVDNSDVSGVEIKLPRMIAVRGRATVEGNGSIPPITVLLTNASFSAAPFHATPRPDGTFSINLPEGEFFAAFDPRRLPTGHSVSALSYGDVDLLRAPIKVSVAESTILSIAFKASAAVGAVKVSGRVVNGAPGAQIFINNSSRPGTSNQQSTVGADGSFEFLQVFPGGYTLNLQPLVTGPTGRTTFQARTTIAVVDTDLSGVEIALPAQKEVTVRVTTEGGAPVPAVSFAFTSASGTARLAGVRFSNGIGKGFFPMDQRQVAIPTLPAGYSVASLTYGSTDLMKEPLKISETDTAEIHVTLAVPQGALRRISGRVTGNVPVDGMLFLNGPASQSARITGDGTFEFTRLPQGIYTANLISGVLQAPVSVRISITTKDITDVEIVVPSAPR